MSFLMLVVSTSIECTAVLNRFYVTLVRSRAWSHSSSNMSTLCTAFGNRLRQDCTTVDAGIGKLPQTDELPGVFVLFLTECV